MQFRLEDISAAEVDRRIDSVRPLVDSVRELIDAVIRTEVDQSVIDDAQQRIAAVVDDLRAESMPGSFGNPFTRELVGMPFGNAATGERNAIAPPMRPVNGDGVSTAEVTLGAPYEGPSGRVHGGIIAMLMDQLVGECASTVSPTPHYTGTLTVRYVRPTMLFTPLTLRAEVTGSEGRKRFVRAEVRDADGVTAEAEAIMIAPKDFPGLDELMAVIGRTSE